MVAGLIIVERCRVVLDSESGNRNAFKLSEWREKAHPVVVWFCEHVCVHLGVGGGECALCVYHFCGVKPPVVNRIQGGIQCPWGCILINCLWSILHLWGAIIVNCIGESFNYSWEVKSLQ